MKTYKILPSVSTFRYRGKHYVPGDYVQLPDEYPAETVPFLEPVAAGFSPAVKAAPPSELEQKYRRTELLEVKPLMVIKSVRRIPQVQEAFSRLSFLDKLFVCSYPPPEVSAVVNAYLKKHADKYTHVLISSDDITPSPECVRQLIEDVSHYDLPSVAGYCNMCFFDHQCPEGVICGPCIGEGEHRQVNVTFEPVATNRIMLDKGKCYQFLSLEAARSLSDIRRVWFQGMACGMISLETWRKIPFRSWNNGEGGLMEDLAFAYDCASKEIPQFVDFRCGMRHWGTHHGRVLVGPEHPRSIKLVRAKKTGDVPQ